MKSGAIIIALLLIGTMVFSTIGFIWEGQQQEKEPAIKIGNEAFDNKVGELSDIDMPLSMPKINEKFYIITENKTYDNIANKLIRLSSSANIRATKACLKEENCTSDLPIVNCNDPVIILQNNIQNKQMQINQKCVTFEGDYYWLNKLSERFVLWLLTKK